LKRAENLKLKRLLASNHLAMAKFELTVKWFSYHIHLFHYIVCTFSIWKRSFSIFFKFIPNDNVKSLLSCQYKNASILTYSKPSSILNMREMKLHKLLTEPIFGYMGKSYRG
jgi:hypothetical protein